MLKSSLYRWALILVIAATSMWSSAQEKSQTGATSLPFEGMKVLGKVSPRSSASIKASPLSVGFETLDRKMFTPERTYPHLAQLGVKWARCQTGWARTETVKGQYDFAWLDSVVDSLLKMGIQPWFNLGYGNRLYTPKAPDESAVGWIPIFDDDAKQAWLKYVRAISEHYKDRVKYWELWNEPNITKFWQPSKPSARDYVEFVKLTAPEIKKQIPDAVIIGGAMAGMPTDFLKQCLDGGICDYVNKISYHPYRPNPDDASYEKSLKEWRALLEKTKPGIALWQGENGSPSKKGGAGALSDLDWDETKQAKWVTRRILSDLRLDVELTSYFHCVDMMNYNWGKGTTGKANLKGLINGTDYTPKPSFFAYQCLCALFDAETKKAEPQIQIEISPAPKTETAPAPNKDATDKEPRFITASFTRKGQPLCIYWQYGDLIKGSAPQKAKITLKTAPNAKLTDPVLIDPLASTIYQVDAKDSDGTWTAAALPLLDYPLILTTRAACDDTK
ncbi:MAG: beta-galactosidase [Candidatus Sumerlaeota bacterium]|nr:beta-galactosidase [Candidatus Sumerlaeota bacterium]